MRLLTYEILCTRTSSRPRGGILFTSTVAPGQHRGTSLTKMSICSITSAGERLFCKSFPLHCKTNSVWLIGIDTTLVESQTDTANDEGPDDGDLRTGESAGRWFHLRIGLWPGGIRVYNRFGDRYRRLPWWNNFGRFTTATIYRNGNFCAIITSLWWWRRVVMVRHILIDQ